MASELLHKAFIVQANGIVIMSDGIDDVTYQSFAEFKEDTGFEMPIRTLQDNSSELAVTINYEYINDKLLHKIRWADGSYTHRDGRTSNTIEALFENFAEIQAKFTARNDPFFGITDVGEAKLIAERAITQTFELEVSGILDNRYGSTERATWERQYDEAKLYMADNAAATPFLDSILTTGESKADIVASILANAAGMLTAVAPSLQRKRDRLAYLSTLSSVEVIKAEDWAQL